MKKKKFGTKTLPLYGKGYPCFGGPLRGAHIFITENSQSTAYIDYRGDFGRYVVMRESLVWHSVKEEDLRQIA